MRIWLDGCYDLMHYGHANALRQAKEMGDVLVAGIHPSSEIEKHKGLPLMSDEERIEVLRANKWVDEVFFFFFFFFFFSFLFFFLGSVVCSQDCGNPQICV